ncbi:PREDICTED: atrial natriuretic peptide receptor 3-like [Priapulus caudatus]|uniref:Atrial natriuretic peptide receptor 3-like n=1 Tax=Priapulus caudatus TaxID=37621 RepID=A0ABM1EIN8_PRICU|nr:PREDICTED: atrial natriuretic peptide receptor 3-like [Priapulus caudatus]
MTRTLGQFRKVGLSFVDILEFYGWQRAGILSSNWSLYKKAARAINDVILLVMPATDRRDIMMHAYLTHDLILDAYMTKGDYVFFIIDMVPNDDVIGSAQTWWGTDNRNEEARQAFESVFRISLAALTETQVNQFRGDKYSPFLHDAVTLYALSLNKTLYQGAYYRNGTLILENAKHIYFKGISGDVLINDNGDRLLDY